MLSGVCVGTNDLVAAGRFYDALLATIGMVRRAADETEIGYGAPGGSPVFWVLLPYDRQNATTGNGTQVMFRAKSDADVDRFHDAALTLGGSNEGPPGLRDYSPDYYGAYCRDLDGNKLHVFNHPG